MKLSLKFWFLGLLVLLAILYFGCTNERKGRLYQLPDGSIVNCKYAVLQDCGMAMSQCSDGKEYVCVDAKYIGESDE
jgi:hypothetical protein